MKTPETYEGPRRLILEDPAVLIGCCAVRLPLGQPAACAADYPFGLAFRSTAGSHRLPNCVGCQLAPTADFRRLPTCVGCQPSGVAFQLNLRLSSASDPRPAFLSTSGLRLRPTLRPNLPDDLQLAPPIDPPAPPLDRPATCAACRSFGHALRRTSSLRLRSIFRLDLPADLQLAPSFDLPALPLNLTSDSHRSLHPTAPPCADQRLAPPVNPWLCLRASLRPSPGASLPALPSKWPPACADCQPSGSALEATSDSRQLLRSRRCRPFNR
jgi:hypothetical protein